MVLHEKAAMDERMTQTSEGDLALPHQDGIDGESPKISSDTSRVDNGTQTSGVKENGPLTAENDILILGNDPLAVGKSDPAENARLEWDSPVEYILSCLGCVVGLGNIWRFPYVCYINGGGAFLIPYLLMVLFVGLPLFLLEVTIGQYSSSGPIMVWEASPLFKGVGITMVFGALLGGTYYNMIIGYASYYMFASFEPELPWQHCGHDYNTKYCYSKEEAEACEAFNGTWVGQQCYNTTNATSVDGSVYETICSKASTGGGTCWNGSFSPTQPYLDDIVTHRRSPSDEYFNFGMLDRSERIEDAEYLKWDISLAYLLVWLLCFVCIAKGIKSVGKAVYFTAVFPYVILIILFVRGITLPGSIDGIKYYILPDWSKLQSPKVWADAACQVFFSLSIGCGGLITYSSYNRFKTNIYRDTLIVTLGDCLTSFFAGFVIFAVLGYMANEQGVQVPDVVTSGSGLMFIVFPEIVTHLPYPNFWAAAFFLMVILLGIDTSFAGVENFMTGVLDVLPALRRRNRTLLAFVYCMAMFVIGLSMCTRAGIYWVELMNYYNGGWSVMLTALIETIAFSWVYGADRVLDDIEQMLGFRPSFFWKFCWKFVSPAIIFGILIFTFVNFEPLTYGDYALPQWAQTIGWLMATVPVATMITYAVYRLGDTYILSDYDGLGLCQRLVKLTTATSKWGPRTEKVSDETTTKKTTLDDESEGEDGLGEGGRRRTNAISFDNPAFEERSTEDRFGSLKFINMV